MSEDDEGLLDGIARYYMRRIGEFGAQARGVDWNGPEGQVLRFEQLCRLLPEGPAISQAMVEAARERFRGSGANFECGEKPKAADYCAASGIFNMRAGATAGGLGSAHRDRAGRDERCKRQRLCVQLPHDVLGLGADASGPILRWSLQWFDFCKRSFLRNIALLHDYGLSEFTILVRKRMGEPER